MAFAKNIYWFRPGRLINSERKNPGILAVDEKYELTAHVLSSDKKCWTYSCKYRLTRSVRCPAIAKVVDIDDRWILSLATDNHKCEPSRPRVVAERLKWKMKELVRKDPVRPVREGLKKGNLLI